jgi:phosphoribosyl 1,2-cyclic phosphodiesterase
MRVTVLASGSGGNSVLVEAEGTRVLIDAGMPPRKLAQRLEHTGLPTRLDDVQAVLVSHEHGDHASGVAALASAGLSVHATAGTIRALAQPGRNGGPPVRLPGACELAAGEVVRVGALRVVPIAVPHDAAEPVMFVIESESGRAGVLVDLGHADPVVSGRFAGLDVLVLEANHDPDLLRLGQYPPTLKRRIAGRLGHLSNEQCTEVLRQIMHGRGESHGALGQGGQAEAPRDPRRGLPRALVLAHLSATNNRPKLARSVVERALPSHQRPRLFVAAQDRATPPLEIGPGGVRAWPSHDQRQLALAFPD